MIDGWGKIDENVEEFESSEKVPKRGNLGTIFFVKESWSDESFRGDNDDLKQDWYTYVGS